MCEEGKSNQCSFCGKQFVLKSCLKIHEVKHNIELRNARCANRNDSGITEGENSNERLNDRFEPECVEKRLNACRSEKESKSVDVWNFRYRNIHKCNVCGRQFTIRGNLKTHMLHHAPKKAISCKICRKTFACIDYYKAHMRKHDTKLSLQCPNCKKIFYDPETYKRHVSKGLRSEYSCIRRSICVDCREVFLSDELLREHTHQKSYHCDTCNQSFSSCEAFKSHVGSHALKCLDCNKVFSNKEDLERHEVICSICQKKFESHVHLKRHARNHLGKEMNQCEICGKVCNKHSFRMHMRRHRGDTPYKCGVCGAAFVIDFYLRKHMKTHSDEKDFECETCGKRFNQKQNLKRHCRIHTGEKPYECPHCSKRFSWSGLFVKHLKQCEKVNSIEPQITVTCNEDFEEEMLSLDRVTLIVPKMGMKVERVDGGNLFF